MCPTQGQETYGPTKCQQTSGIDWREETRMDRSSYTALRVLFPLIVILSSSAYAQTPTPGVPPDHIEQVDENSTGFFTLYFYDQNGSPTSCSSVICTVSDSGKGGVLYSTGVVSSPGVSYQMLIPPSVNARTSTSRACGTITRPIDCTWTWGAGYQNTGEWTETVNVHCFSPPSITNPLSTPTP